MISAGVSAVVDRPAHVHRDLVLGADRGQRGERDDAARPAVEAGARPHVAPRAAGDEVLERRGQLARVRDRAVDVGVAEHRPADAHALRVALGVVHRTSRWERISRVTSSARSMFARCAAVEQLEARARDPLGDQLAVGRRRRRIGAAGDHERRGVDGADRLDLVHAGDRLAAAGVALGRRVLERRAAASRRCRAAGRRSPRVNQRVDGRLGDRARPLLAHGPRARGPVVFFVEHRRRAASGRGGRPARARCTPSHMPGHPAERDARRRGRARRRGGRAARARRRRGRRASTARRAPARAPWPRVS